MFCLKQQVGKQLEQSALNQKELLNVQKESLVVQEKLLKHGHDLEKVVGTIVSGVAYSQQTLLHIQKWLISEMALFDCVLFYAISLFFVFIFTSLPSTNTCRLPLLLLLFAGILAERFICKLYLAFNLEEKIDNSHAFLMKIIWFLRYALVALCVFSVIFSICSYKDYLRVNHKLLQELHVQNRELIRLLERNETRSNGTQIAGLLGEVNKQKESVNSIKRYHLRSRQGTPEKV